MVLIDPRANPTLGADFISGQITDKALALLDILNQVTGTQGTNVKQFDILENGQTSAATLGVYNISAGTNAWDANQLVYFQSTPQRLALIQQKLQNNLARIESDITNNIVTLFDLIQKNSANGGLDIQGQLDTAEVALNNASGDSILSTGKDLEQQILTLLTSDTALDTLIDAFITKFKLDVSRLDSEIFDLFDDNDGVYSSRNGQDSTSSNSTKYLVSFGAGKPAVIADSIDEVFDITFKSQYETDHGAGSWTSAVEQSTLLTFVGNAFQQGKLSLDPGLIEAIIADKNISDDELAGITQQGQFLRKYGFSEFLTLAGNYYNTGANTDATIKQLSLAHLKSLTPQYFDDNRTLQDIVGGKDTSSSNSSSLNKVFQGTGDQINQAISGAIELLGSGYKQLSTNNFEDFVRNNPILIVQYLESKHDPALDNQIKLLMEFNIRKIEGQIFYYTEANKRLEEDASPNLKEIQHNQQMLNILEGYEGKSGILAKLKDYPKNASSSDIINLYHNPALDPELQLDTIDTSTISDSALNQIINSGLSIQNVHAALYANEILEAGKINANYTGRELPKANDDGEIPEDTTMAPPQISPTILSGVIAAMGNAILYKANNLLRSSDVPDSNWVTNNVTILKDIDDKIASGALARGTTAGKAFLDNLKLVFRNIIKQFVTSDVQTFKSSVDQAKTAIASQDTLVGSSINPINPNDTEGNLDKIEQALNGDIYTDGNFINDAGLNNIKPYLENVITNASSQIQAKNLIIDTITNTLVPGKQKQIDDAIANGEDPSQIQSLQNELKNMQDDLKSKQNEKAIEQSYINRATHLLYDPGKINDLISQLINNINSVIDPNNPPTDIKATLLGIYRVRLESYSNKLTDHFKDDTDGNGTTDIEQMFKDTLTGTSLDLNKDGINDFQNIQNAIDKISNLGDSITNIFGSKDASEGGIDKQSIRRLILMMFAMSILEYSDWDYHKAEADMSNYSA